MRLICPNCDTEYDVPDGMMPAAGRHVQCTACHTRWFARGTAEAAPSEDQIVTRLETRSPPRPEPVAAEAGAAEAAAETPVVPLRLAEPARAAAPPVPRPGEIAATAPAPRAAPRLALDPPPAEARPAPPEPRSRFGLGLAVALLFFLLALAAYDQRGDIAAELPAAGPALESYADAVDDLRDQVEQRLATLRARIDG